VLEMGHVLVLKLISPEIDIWRREIKKIFEGGIIKRYLKAGGGGTKRDI